MSASRPYSSISALLAVHAIAAGAFAPAEARSAQERSAPESAAAAQQLRAARYGEAAGGPLTIVVSIGRQRLSVYDGLRKIAESPISSGTASNPTPTGIFSVLQKNRIHFSNLYDDAPMPFMQRITWSGVALHAGHLPGYPASHGCIRLPQSFAARLFEMTKIGARVIVSREEPVPQSFAHAHLPAPLPSAAALAPRGAEKPVDNNTVGALIGVTTANAAPAEAALALVDGRRTRESVAAERAKEKAEIVAALDKARTAEAEAARTLADAAAKAADAKGTVKRYRDEADAIEREIARVGRARSGIEQQAAQFIRRNAGQEGDPSEKAVDTEDQLEARMLQLHHEEDALKADLEDQRHFIPRAAAEAEEKEAARLTAASDHAKAARLVADVKEELTDWERAEARRHLPASIFVSRKTGTISVRQGHEPILEAPVRIAYPDAPLGTHVFTAHAFTGGEQAQSHVLTWSAVTVPAREDETPPRARAKSGARGEEVAAGPVVRPPVTPENALQRLSIPDDVAERLSEIVKPGSSLIISDQGTSNETGKHTDFIVSTR